MKSIFLFLALLVVPAYGNQDRVDHDSTTGNPIVIQLSVALADNKNQWIVPVPDAIGNGQNPRNNLYWGARYGVKTYLSRDSGWQTIALPHTEDRRILERRVMKKRFSRKGKPVDVYLVADAWDGKEIRQTINQFLRYNAGYDTISLQVDRQTIQAGGKAHLIVYIGHNALMDFAGATDLMTATPQKAMNNPQNDAIVLACKSEPYFASRLRQLGANPLLMTTGLMAPEAYSLDAAISQWIVGNNERNIRRSAAESYNKYQKTGIKAARRLFGTH